MRAKLKSVGADEVNIKSYVPDDSRCFSIGVRLCIGLDDSEGGDDFEVFVCTPEWLVKNLSEPVWGRHFLIVRDFDYGALVDVITSRVDLCSGRSWPEIAGKLARFFSWEFEDYQA